MSIVASDELRSWPRVISWGIRHIDIPTLTKASLLAATLTLLGGWPAHAYPPLVEQAFANMGDKYDWSFTVSTHTLKGARTERHDVGSGESQWILLEVDGEQPTVTTQQDYQERKAKQAEERGPRSGNGFDSLAGSDSFKLIEENASHAVYAFQPSPDSEDEADVTKMLRGLMTINKDGPYVKLPISRETLLEVFGEPIRWEKAPRPPSGP